MNDRSQKPPLWRRASNYTFWVWLHDTMSKEWFNFGYARGSIVSTAPLLGCIPFLLLGWIMYATSHDNGRVIYPEMARYADNFVGSPLGFAVINFVFISFNYKPLDKDKKVTKAYLACGST